MYVLGIKDKSTYKLQKNAHNFMAFETFGRVTFVLACNDACKDVAFVLSSGGTFEKVHKRMITVLLGVPLAEFDKHCL